MANKIKFEYSLKHTVLWVTITNVLAIFLCILDSQLRWFLRYIPGTPEDKILQYDDEVLYLSCL